MNKKSITKKIRSPSEINDYLERADLSDAFDKRGIVKDPVKPIHLQRTFNRITKLIAKFFLSLIFCLMFVPSAWAINVYQTPYESQARIKVYITPYESQADIVVYRSPYESQAKGTNVKWFFIEYESQADVKIYVTNYESQADLKVYFTTYESQARVINTKKILFP